MYFLRDISFLQIMFPFSVVYAYAFYPTPPKYRIGKRYTRILSAPEVPRKEPINALR